MLVVLAILGIVLAGLTVLFTSAMRSQTDQTNRVNAQQDARVALDQLRRELRCASALLQLGVAVRHPALVLPLAEHDAGATYLPPRSRR